MNNNKFPTLFQFHRVIRGTANESDDRQRINNVAMLDGPIDREEDMEARDENKDLEQENEELKVNQSRGGTSLDSGSKGLGLIFGSQ